MFGSGQISAGELVIIITTTASAVVTVINSIASGWGRKEIKQSVENLSSKTGDNSNKLELIHNSTNGTLSKVQSQLDDAMKMIRNLEERIGKENKDASH